MNAKNMLLGLIVFGIAAAYGHITKRDHSDRLSRSARCNVTFLGGRRAGKTSVLVSMYETFPLLSTALRLDVDDTSSLTAYKLADRLQALRSISEVEGGYVASLEGDDIPNRYRFLLEKQLLNGTLPTDQVLEFRDFPGSFMDAGGPWHLNGGQPTDLSRSLSESQVAVVAIDSPYLMEEKGRYHHLRNRPERVAELIKATFVPSPDPRLILLVPVRSEKYVQTEADRKRLFSQVRIGYQTLLEVCFSVKDRIRIVTVPVQTTGNLCFRSFVPSPGDEIPSPLFTLLSVDPTFRPQACEQPLLHVLSYALLQLRRANESSLWGIFNDDSELVRAIHELTSHLNHPSLYDVIQPGSVSS